MAPVYDILNAGPRHRFTVSGKVVSNCLYGMGDAALASKIGVSAAKASRTRDAIMGAFKVLDRWCKDCISESRRTGYAYTWWNGQRARRRPLWRIADHDDGVRIQAENGSFNTPVQGSASDYCIASLAETVRWIEGDGLSDVVKLVLPIHDALLLEVRDDYVDETVGVVRGIMTGWPANGVPLAVDVETGPAWGSLEKRKSA